MTKRNTLRFIEKERGEPGQDPGGAGQDRRPDDPPKISICDACRCAPPVADRNVGGTCCAASEWGSAGGVMAASSAPVPVPRENAFASTDYPAPRLVRSLLASPPDRWVSNGRPVLPTTSTTNTRVRARLTPRRRPDFRRDSAPRSLLLEHAHDRSPIHLGGLHATPFGTRRNAGVAGRG